MWLIKALKFPLWLLKLFVKKPNKKISEREKKRRAYVRNFDSTRLKNRSWQVRSGKKTSKNLRKYYQKKVKNKQTKLK